MRSLLPRDQVTGDDASGVFLLATDRLRKRRRRWPYVVGGAAVLLVFGIIALYALSSRTATTLAVSSETLTIAPVTRGTFTEFIPLRGRILPRETVYLDIVQGGRVEEIHKRAGDYVKAGTPLVRISNPTLELSISTQESSTIDYLNSQMSLRLNVSQTLSSTEAALEEAQYHVEQLQREHAMQRQLAEKGIGPAAEERRLNEDLAYWTAISEIRTRALGRTKTQAEEIERSINETSVRLEETIRAARSQLDALVIRAPITGYLTRLEVSLGQHLATGQSVGQIDDNEGFKVEALLDEFYLGRVRVGQRVFASIEGTDVTLTVASISPHITDGQFKIEADFDPSTSLSGITRGQAISGRLELSQREKRGFDDPAWGFLGNDRGKLDFRSKRIDRHQTNHKGRKTHD